MGLFSNLTSIITAPIKVANAVLKPIKNTTDKIVEDITDLFDD